VKRLPQNTTKEQSTTNSVTVLAFKGKNAVLIDYLDLEQFKRDLEQARLEKSEVVNAR
jgi:hypothetical protein